MVEGRACGRRVGTVNRDLKMLRQQWCEGATIDVSMAMEIDVQRLERLLRTLWPRATSGELPAIDRVMHVIDMRRGLLRYSELPRFTTPGESHEIVMVEVIKLSLIHI